ncbi:hypothetical protein COY28_00510, partial [Candidatus Woesearchaeota archaeon CG_4_10_14_0_2_um_filter_57_5]
VALLRGVVVTILLLFPVLAAAGWLDKGWFRVVGLGTAGLTIASFALLGGCFLTYWEQALRAGTASAYSGGFLSHYVNKARIPLTDQGALLLFIFMLSLGVIIIALRHRRDGAGRL